MSVHLCVYVKENHEELLNGGTELNEIFRGYKVAVVERLGG